MTTITTPSATPGKTFRLALLAAAALIAFSAGESRAGVTITYESPSLYYSYSDGGRHHHAPRFRPGHGYKPGYYHKQGYRHPGYYYKGRPGHVAWKNGPHFKPGHGNKPNFRPEHNGRPGFKPGDQGRPHGKPGHSGGKGRPGQHRR